MAGKYDDGIQIIKIEPEYISAHTSNQNPPFEIIPHLIPSPFTAITDNMPGFSSIHGPREISTFEIGDYTYASVLSMPNYDLFPDTLVILNITDPSYQSIVSSIDHNLA